jgi:hypothetical protein
MNTVVFEKSEHQRRHVKVVKLDSTSSGLPASIDLMKNRLL